MSRIYLNSKEKFVYYSPVWVAFFIPLFLIEEMFLYQRIGISSDSIIALAICTIPAIILFIKRYRKLTFSIIKVQLSKDQFDEIIRICSANLNWVIHQSESEHIKMLKLSEQSKIEIITIVFEDNQILFNSRSNTESIFISIVNGWNNKDKHFFISVINKVLNNLPLNTNSKKTSNNRLKTTLMYFASTALIVVGVLGITISESVDDYFKFLLLSGLGVFWIVLDFLTKKETNKK